MLEIVTIFLCVFVVRHATQSCTSNVECERLQTHAYCLSGKCVIQPCSGTCDSAEPLLLPDCCTRKQEPDPLPCTDDTGPQRSCRIRSQCFFRDCDDGLCVPKPCDLNVQCIGDTQLCKCVLGNCFPRINCTQNNDCNATIDELCVKGVCRTINCPYQSNQCIIAPNSVNGCFSELCNIRGNCFAVPCPVPGSARGGPDDSIDLDGADGVGLEIEIEMGNSSDTIVIASLFIVIIGLVIIGCCAFAIYKKRK